MAYLKSSTAALAFALCACAQVEPVSRNTVAHNRPMPALHSSDAGCSDKCDKPPRLISGRAPIYPISKLLKGAPGEATIRFTIAADGTTKDIEVLSATYEYFGTHAAIAVKDWRFEPAMKDGQPVEMKVHQTFTFTAQ